MFERFDRAALSVEPPAGYRAGPPNADQAAAWQWLQSWCFEDLKRPWAMAYLVGTAGSGRSHLAEAFSRHLDGDERLQQLRPGWPRLRLRLAVKLADSLPWRARQPGDPWDCGFLPGNEAALQALGRFLPRRATLMVADELPPSAVAERIAALAPRQAQFRQPVRLLIVERGPAWSIKRA